MGHNKQISGELVFVQILNFIKQLFFIIQMDALLMYHKFDYNL